ncbi:MarR family transcriptional regulator [Luteibacter pinisoli]|uniref:MarR family transcriptional regulator n=1 Tax=Luteibacter pinisoli TaxID=2589080 RepID=A0A4Y5Z5K4_9GAMM|nr:MarR family transcriptional regulator [Luteibacter pinisoli]QDE39849.1 MarR family transcriptional regulator [Luteibacter pinisoli]
MEVVCHSMALTQAARRVEVLYDQALAPTGLRAAQYQLLATIAAIGPIELSALARVMVLDRRPLAAQLRPLVDDGLVVYADAERRTRVVSVTTRGKRLARRGERLWQSAQAHFESAIGPARANALRARLHDVIHADLGTV